MGMWVTPATLDRRHGYCGVSSTLNSPPTINMSRNFARTWSIDPNLAATLAGPWIEEQINSFAACLAVAQLLLISTLVIDMPIRRCRNGQY